MSIGSFFQIFIAIIFSISAVAKLIALPSFRKTLENIGIPGKFRSFVSIVVPILELVISVMILWEVTLTFGLLLLFLLLLAFLGAVLYSFTKQNRISCNCFGSIADETLGWGTIVKIILLGASGVYVLWESQYSSIWNYEIIDVILTVFISIAVLIIYSMLISLVNERKKHLNKSMGSSV